MVQDYRWTSPKTTELFKAILTLKTVKECERFFRDLLTLEEIREFVVRWQMAQMLDKGMSYREIAEKIKTSTTTVARVAHWLHYGMGGYRLVLDRLKKK